jgi:lysophospholipase
MENAPFFADVADGPADCAAWWVHAEDGVRLRLCAWARAAATGGTVLLFPGRTEYLEKYGRTAADLAARGFATMAIDWRGQGLSDRLLADRRIGHVDRFTDYQHDVAAMVAAAQAQALPRPWFLLAHSMGGCIGLRAVMERDDVTACAFTGPMWGIAMSPVSRALGGALAAASATLGIGHRLAPSTKAETYVKAEPFEGNMLTTDSDMYAYMQAQCLQYPELALGGPSLHWVHQALSETRALARRPSPDLPCATFVGSNERIVDLDRIAERMKAWPRGTLERVEGAEHEVLMERAAMRTPVTDAITSLFTGAA